MKLRLGIENKSLVWLGALAAALVIPGVASAKETRSFVMSWFSQAMASEDGDCKGGLNPKIDPQYGKDLLDLGIPGNEAEKLLETRRDEGRGWDKNKVGQLMNMRARINGQPANAYAHPAAVVDPRLTYSTGKHAYGFNLDGKGTEDPTAFEDPETHEKGVDNQLSRALGCIEPFRGTIEHGTAFWLFMWMAEKDSSPAWLITLTGDDLSKDGPVTIKFSRALEIPKFNADGEGRADMTYREDPDPKVAGNVFKGEIKNGVVTISENGGHLHMIQEQLTYPYFDMNNFHVRLTLAQNGNISGYIGGYQPIEEAYFAIAQGGYAAEGSYAPEEPGMYHLMRRLADGDPDPKTGQNWSISATFYLKGVPAFVAPATNPNSTIPRSPASVAQH